MSHLAEVVKISAMENEAGAKIEYAANLEIDSAANLKIDSAAIEDDAGHKDLARGMLH